MKYSELLVTPAIGAAAARPWHAASTAGPDVVSVTWWSMSSAAT
jgi:hypothetical protein